MFSYVRVERDVDRRNWLRTRQNVYLGTEVIAATVDHAGGCSRSSTPQE
jgi:hypothetical protein